MFALNRSSRRTDACDWDSHVNRQQLESAAAAADDGGDILSWLLGLVGGIGGQYNFSQRRRLYKLISPIKTIGPIIKS